MSIYFLDSSALIKRYVTERGSTWVRAITHPDAGNTIVIAQLTPVEIISGLARKQREAGISAGTLQAAIRLVQRHVTREYVVVHFTTQVEQSAIALLFSHPLRAYDAVQLASALVIHRQVIEANINALVFVAADARLLATAASEGLPVADPNEQP